MPFPADLKYTKDHEWAKIEGKQVTIGITDHAQKALGDIVYVDVPTEGRVLKKHETFGVVESIKAVSDLYAPVAGKVVAANKQLADDPALVNRDPYGGAWMIKLELADPAAASDLLDASAYTQYVESLK
jgi:glycine cleavage system H protein